MNKQILAGATLLAFATWAMAEKQFPLFGQWRFRLDRMDAGAREQWFERALPDKITLPGSLPAQGIGDAVSTATKWIGSIVDQSCFNAPEFARYRQPGNVKVPVWLTPDTYYAGAAWYQFDIEIPADWSGKRVVLSLERSHWETRVWVDNKPFGTNNALATPHEYDLGQIAPGKHSLTIRTDNRMVLDVGENSHSISDHTQGNWNGIVGKIELRGTPLAWIEDLQVHPHIKSKSAVVRRRLGNATGKVLTNSVGLCLRDRFDAQPRFPTTNVSVECPATGGLFEAELNCGDPVTPWDEFSPRLYVLTAQVGSLPDLDSREVRFGFAETSTRGTQFLINGRKTFFRGTLDCCIYPLTGHPPTDVESWKRVIRVCKAHGLNMIRFRSWCPPEAVFAAADDLGCYFHVEASSWANASTTIGDGKPVDGWICTETDRILKYYGNHPSFVLMPHGNEPGGDHHATYLAKWVSHYKARDPRRLWTSGLGWPELPENQWHSTPNPHVQGWGEGLKSRINARPPETTNAFDGDSETIWHTPGSEWAAGFPHEIAVEFDSVKTLAGFSALPRQDGNHKGWIRDYAVYASADGRDWGEPVAKGSFNSTKELKTVTFKPPSQARFVKPVALSAFDEQPFSALAEPEFLSAGQDQS